MVVAGGRVAITLLDLEHDPRRIEAAARRAGLDVRVTAVPVGPSLVGRFVAESGMGSLPSELLALGGDTRAFVGFSLPEGWSGTLDLTVGRPPRWRGVPRAR